jgi:hypothetical protein
MKNKILILGPQCSGKTILAENLRKVLTIPVLEEDEAMVKENSGTMPTDYHLKYEVLRPKIAREIVSNSTDIVFLTSYIDPYLLAIAKDNGFKILQLQADKAVLDQRNTKRMAEEGKPDASPGLNINLPYHSSLSENGFVDKAIDAGRPPETIAQEVTEYITEH